MNEARHQYSRTRGISSVNRGLLATLNRANRAFITPRDAAELWEMDEGRARRLLAQLARNGWLSRVRRGMYITVPIEASKPEQWPSDTWQLAVQMLDPCYLGGWTACEYWELTDQIFRDIVVFTSRAVRERLIPIQGAGIRIVRIDQRKFFGLVTKWRDGSRITLSDPTRTIVDVLARPSIGGGIRHVADVVSAYFRSSARDDELLVRYCLELANRAVFKRLGYIVEALRLQDTTELVNACRQHMSSGISKLDPSAGVKGRISTRWNLRLNVVVEPEQ